jgi:hypothetical protein
LYVPVARLSIITNNSIPTSNKFNFSEINFQLVTKGPLKLYRNYSSKGYIKKNNNTSWEYYLSGKDRGQPEEKLITYHSSDVPYIEKFIDDMGVDPILVDPLKDVGAVDPFTVLTNTIHQLRNEKNCKDIFFVMDGKRRSEVKLLFIGKTDSSLSKTRLNGDIYHCQFKLSNKKTEELNKTKKQWPFKEKDKSIDVWFSERLNFIPVKFEFQGPFGKIKGILASK